MSSTGKDAKGGGGRPLVSQEAQGNLRKTPELDYLTHIVMRLYENKQCVTAAAAVLMRPSLSWPACKAPGMQHLLCLVRSSTPKALHLWRGRCCLGRCSVPNALLSCASLRAAAIQLRHRVLCSVTSAGPHLHLRSM